MLNYAGAKNFLLIYAIIIGISLIFGAFGEMEQKTKKWYIIFVFGFMAFLSAFRGSDIGNDTNNYIQFFKVTSNYTTPFERMGTTLSEPGFVIYCWLLSQLSTEPQILLIATSVIIYVSVGRFVYKNAGSPGLLACLFFGTMQFDSTCNIMRQSIAMAILLCAFKYIVKRKPIKFFLVCVVAISFHYAAILFLFVYPIVNVLGKKVYNYLLVFVAVFSFLFFDKMLEVLLTIFPKYSYYLGGERLNGVIRLASITKILVYGLMYFAPSLFRTNKEKSMQNYTIYNKFAIVNICTLLISLNATAFDRFASLFSIIVITDYTNNVVNLHSHDKTILTIISLLAFAAYGCVYIIYRTPEWTTTFPLELIF